MNPLDEKLKNIFIRKKFEAFTYLVAKVYLLDEIT